jgi:hypothetical protein
MSDERAGPRVAAVLEGIALQNACGALEVEGYPGGVIYLDKGQVTYAQSDWSPDLAARLLGTLRSAAGLRELVAAGDQPAGNLGALLIEHGHVSADELAALLHSVIVDAIIALTVPLEDEASVAGMRLVSGRAHWAGGFTRLGIGAVRAEAMSRAERMAACPVPRSAPLELCDLARGSAVLTSEQWALACDLTGTFTAKDLAWAAGFSMYETVGCVGDLVEAGLCAPCPRVESASEWGANPASFGPGGVSELPTGLEQTRQAESRPHVPRPAGGSSPVSQPMPRRKPGEFAAVANAAAAALAGAQASVVAGAQTGNEEAGVLGDASGPADAAPLPVESELTPVPVDSLRRVLEGLRKLS